MRRYRWLFGVAASILIIALGFIIQVEYGPSDSERVIVDYSNNAYSSPACFDQAGFTNNIGESTYGEVANDSTYVPESSCTAVEFATKRGPLWFAWFM